MERGEVEVNRRRWGETQWGRWIWGGAGGTAEVTIKMQHRREAGMNDFCFPTSRKLRKVLPTFQTFCPVAQTVLHFAHFQVKVRKRGVSEWALGCSMYVHIPKRGV